jgi:hypothetical protein
MYFSQMYRGVEEDLVAFWSELKNWIHFSARHRIGEKGLILEGVRRKTNG